MSRTSFKLKRPEIGKRLEQVIRHKWGTNAAAAKALGLSNTAMHTYVHGKHLPTSIVVNVALATGASVDWIVNGVGEPGIDLVTAKPAAEKTVALAELRLMVRDGEVYVPRGGKMVKASRTVELAAKILLDVLGQ